MAQLEVDNGTQEEPKPQPKKTVKAKPKEPEPEPEEETEEDEEEPEEEIEQKAPPPPKRVIHNKIPPSRQPPRQFKRQSRIPPPPREPTDNELYDNANIELLRQRLYQQTRQRLNNDLFGY